MQTNSSAKYRKRDQKVQVNMTNQRRQNITTKTWSTEAFNEVLPTQS